MYNLNARETKGSSRIFNPGLESWRVQPLAHARPFRQFYCEERDEQMTHVSLCTSHSIINPKRHLAGPPFLEANELLKIRKTYYEFPSYTPLP